MTAKKMKNNRAIGLLPFHVYCSSLSEVQTDYKEIRKFMSEKHKKDVHQLQSIRETKYSYSTKIASKIWNFSFTPVFTNKPFPSDNGPIVLLYNLKDSLLPGEELYCLLEYQRHCELKESKGSQKKIITQEKEKATGVSGSRLNKSNISSIQANLENSDDDLMDWEKRQDFLLRITKNLEEDNSENKNRNMKNLNNRKNISTMLSPLGNHAIRRNTLAKDDEQNGNNINKKENLTKTKTKTIPENVLTYNKNNKSFTSPKDSCEAFENNKNYTVTKDEKVPSKKRKTLGKTKKKSEPVQTNNQRLLRSKKHSKVVDKENTICEVGRNTRRRKIDQTKLTRKVSDDEKIEIAKRYELMEEKISKIGYEEFIKLMPSDSETTNDEKPSTSKCDEDDVFIKPISSLKKKKKKSTANPSIVSFISPANDAQRRRTLYSPSQFEMSEEARRIFEID